MIDASRQGFKQDARMAILHVLKVLWQKPGQTNQIQNAGNMHQLANQQENLPC